MPQITLNLSDDEYNYICLLATELKIDLVEFSEHVATNYSYAAAKDIADEENAANGYTSEVIDPGRRLGAMMKAALAGDLSVFDED